MRWGNSRRSNLGYGDIEMTNEDSFFGCEGDFYINNEKLKMKTAEKRDFWEGKDRRGFETYDDKTKEEYEKDTNWYITFEYWDEGWFELEVEDDEFDKSKLKWSGDSLSYDDDAGFDDIGSKPSENMYAMHFPKIDRFFRLNTLETWN